MLLILLMIMMLGHPFRGAVGSAVLGAYVDYVVDDDDDDDDVGVAVLMCCRVTRFGC